MLTICPDCALEYNPATYTVKAGCPACGAGRTTLDPVTCHRCGYIWTPRIPNPKCCSRCKSHEWQAPRNRDLVGPPSEYINRKYGKLVTEPSRPNLGQPFPDK